MRRERAELLVDIDNAKHFKRSSRIREQFRNYNRSHRSLNGQFPDKRSKQKAIT
jgi:hypothetical protein